MSSWPESEDLQSPFPPAELTEHLGWQTSLEVRFIFIVGGVLRSDVGQEGQLLPR